MLSDRFSEALIFAERLHRTQTRKGNEVPYVAHLLAVAATVLEWGGDEDVAIAALLHDAVEDQGGVPTAELIRVRFGDRVADLVLACTDSLADDPALKVPWRERKAAYLAKLEAAAPDVALIAAADKLHNISAILRDLERDGLPTLARFNAGREGLAWYYPTVCEALSSHEAVAPVAELRVKTRRLLELIDDPHARGT
jgi:(p)ppGpp synthase/HD superfamily hydrolase